MNARPAVLLAVLMLSTLPLAPAAAYPGDVVVLQGLDKVTARVSTFEVPLGVTVRFGTLAITLRGCDRAPPEDPPESAAFLDIYEARPGEKPVELFRGWMFASSPALSALEHPVYDVWVLECKRTAPPPATPAAPKEPAPDTPLPAAHTPPAAN